MNISQNNCTEFSAKFSRRPASAEHLSPMETTMEKALRKKCDFGIEKFDCLDKSSEHTEYQHKVPERRKNNSKCNLCGQEFRAAQALLNHMTAHTGERPFKCEVSGCGMAFKREAHLSDHIKCKHSDERPHRCDFLGCIYTAKTSKSLQHHKNAHTDERPHACPNSGCGFRAKTNGELRNHVKCVHCETKAFACTKCDYKTARSGHLKRHMLCHSSKRDFRCSHPQCTESFKYSSDLKRHFRNRHGEKNTLCNHPGCGVNFSSAKALNDHKRRAHMKKIYACLNPECSYRATEARMVARHMVIHKGSNANIPCSVEGCKYKGKNSSVFKQHMSRHKILLPCPVSGCNRHAATEEALSTHAKLHNPSGRAFQCSLCYKHYPTLKSLQRHCVVHTNEKPFNCGHCKYEAATHAY